MGASELFVPEWTFWGWAMAYDIEKHPDESTSKFLRENLLLLKSVGKYPANLSRC
jgi:hypothetical protein